MGHYALGYAFNLEDLFYNFKSDKLLIDCVSLDRLYGDRHKKNFSRKVFKDCCKLVINDLIENDIEFQLPTGSRKCSIMMRPISNQNFKQARKNGAFKNIDFLSSMFTGYEITLYMYGNNRALRTKKIYLNPQLNKKFTDYINSGKTYGGRLIKTVNDFLPLIQALYPRIPISDIKKILNFGWKSLYLHNSYGGDTLITDNTFWFYIGKLSNNSLYHYDYYCKKLGVKLRVQYKKKKILWDGYYYFALNDSQYESYCNQKHKRGRPKKWFDYGTVKLYKILDECKVREHMCKYIFKVPISIDFGYALFRNDYKSDCAELIITRETLKLKDILTSNNDYEFI